MSSDACLQIASSCLCILNSNWLSSAIKSLRVHCIFMSLKGSIPFRNPRSLPAGTSLDGTILMRPSLSITRRMLLVAAAGAFPEDSVSMGAAPDDDESTQVSGSTRQCSIDPCTIPCSARVLLLSSGCSHFGSNDKGCWNSTWGRVDRIAASTSETVAVRSSMLSTRQRPTFDRIRKSISSSCFMDNLRVL